MFKGYIQVYTGNGKGKTTAAIGLAIRAVGAGLKVLMLQFMKSKSYSEHNLLPQLSPNLTLEMLGKPFFIAEQGCLSAEEAEAWGEEVVVFPPGQPPDQYVKLIASGIERAKNAVASGGYDVVILDEFNVAMHFGLITQCQLQSILAVRLPQVELIFTGRGAPSALLQCAHVVTDMQEVKHYYQQGVEARLGIDN